MKILYLIPGRTGPGFDQDEVDRRTGILKEMASPGTEILAAVSGDGPLCIESECDEAYAIPSAITAAVKAEKDGYDCIILGCAGDPGLNALKEAVGIPVVGPAQVTYALASLVGRKFSVITPVDGTVGTTLDLIAKYGFKDNFASCISARIPVNEIVTDPLKSMKIVKEHSIKALEQDGADCIVLGCMSMAFAEFDEELREELGVPVINPVKSALYVAEGMVRMGLKQSAKAFPPVKR